MRVYTVHESKDPPSDRLDRAEALRFVREGFSWTAAIFAPLWLLVRGFWLALLVYVVVAVVLTFGVQALGLGDEIQSLLMIALHVLVGFEADTIERWTLKRQGWEMIGTVSGRDVVECERRFFDSWLPDQPLLRPETLSVSQITGSGEASMPLGGMRGDRGGWRSAFPFSARR
ncbi:MAG: DUF2628 domain-containing protein [Hyphomicrobium sp.]|nr:DUF2628 domain-containing protein [Hyphomicrobium sp.]